MCIELKKKLNIRGKTIGILEPENGLTIKDCLKETVAYIYKAKCDGFVMTINRVEMRFDKSVTVDQLDKQFRDGLHRRRNQY